MGCSPAWAGRGSAHRNDWSGAMVSITHYVRHGKGSSLCRNAMGSSVARGWDDRTGVFACPPFHEWREGGWGSEILKGRDSRIGHLQ